jgi:hypothetical protein
MKTVAIAIPFATVAGAAVLYPKVCSLPEHMRVEKAKHFIVTKAAPAAG